MSALTIRPGGQEMGFLGSARQIDKAVEIR
jgi:hypothetical protein